MVVGKSIIARYELGRNPVTTKFSLSMEVSRLTRDETAESVSRDQILKREWRQLGKYTFFPVQLRQRAGLATLPCSSILLLYV